MPEAYRPRPLRIGYLLGGLRPGGSERQMLHLAQRLPRDRFSVDFLVLMGPSVYDDRARATGATLQHLGTPPDTNASVVRGSLQRSGKLFKYLQVARRRRYDIIDAWLYPADVIAALCRPLTKTPIVVSGRRNLDPHDRFGPIDPLLDRLTMLLTDAVVANSAAAGRHAVMTQHVPQAKLRVIRNGVEVPPLPGPEQRLAARTALGLGADDLVIGCVGNLHPLKRHAMLLDVIATVGRDRPGLRLVLVGDGSQRADLEARCQTLGIVDLVRFVGSVEDPLPLYAGFDVVVQASRSEGLPNVLLEAAAAGRAIVATAAGGSDEVVLDGHTGLLVPTDDADALAAALCRMIDDPELRARSGAAAREHVEAAFGMDRLVAEVTSLYEELAARAGIIPAAG